MYACWRRESELRVPMAVAVLGIEYRVGYEESEHEPFGDEQEGGCP